MRFGVAVAATVGVVETVGVVLGDGLVVGVAPGVGVAKAAVAAGVFVGAAIGVEAVDEHAASATAAVAVRRRRNDLLPLLAEEVGTIGSRMGAFPFLAKEIGTTMGPATGLPALDAPVTVAGLCRTLTGFADPTDLSLSWPPQSTRFRSGDERQISGR